LFENKSKRGFIYGYTDNNVKVKLPWDPQLCNTLHEVKLTGINGSFMQFNFVKEGGFITHKDYSKI
jgi:threonylcarbamoyladenosine tRNA methylthiotransferase MtaB